MSRESRTENHRMTMSMRFITKIDRPIGIDGQELEDVDKFTYFGSKVTKEVIKFSAQTATSAFLSLRSIVKALPKHDVYKNPRNVKWRHHYVITVPPYCCRYRLLIL